LFHKTTAYTNKSRSFVKTNRLHSHFMDSKLLASFFQTHGGIVRTRQLQAGGFSHYQLRPLIEQGQILRLKQGLYKWQTDDHSELLEVASIVPGGVFCLLTAAAYYELTTFTASDYSVAIPRKAKVVLPHYPPIKLYYWNEAAYQLGQTTINLNGTMLPIYDVEKTVCDVLRQRHKLGLDLAKEVLTNYLRRPDRQIARLVEYASSLGLGSYLDTTLPVLL
jgi:predicted transcriptional regulator of viral defense system